MYTTLLQDYVFLRSSIQGREIGILSVSSDTQWKSSSTLDMYPLGIVPYGELRQFE